MSIVFASASSQRLDNTSTGIVTAAPFTLYGWGKFTGSKPGSSWMVFLGPMLDFDSYAVVWYQAQFAVDLLAVRIEDSSGGESTVSMADIGGDTWFPFVGVFKSTTSRTLHRTTGAGTEDTTSKALPAVNRFHVGALWNSGSYIYHLNGELADIGIVPKEATSGEIADYLSGISGKVVWPGGVYSSRNGERAHWDLFDNTDLTDTFNSIALTANGSPTSGTHPSLSYGGSAAIPVLLPKHYRSGRAQVLMPGVRN